MDYRREIDGLRALAVFPVILFHAGFQTFSGGFVGVDIFFVISGYLITTIILSELEQGRFSIVKFYERRARRILPALFLIMFFCLPFAWLWLIPQDMKDFSQSLVAVSVFSSNILFLRTSGYFDTAAELKPLLHTWSLAVEEQYYLFFPMLLMVTWKFGKRFLYYILGTAFLISLAAAQWLSEVKPMAAFFLLPTRGWELLTGAFVSIFFSTYGNKSIPKVLSEVGGAVGIALIIYAIFIFDKHTPSPSLYTLIPTLGTALIILCATHKTLAAQLLGNRIFVGLGLTSYSAYLWHQPLLAFAREQGTSEAGSLIFFSIPALSVLLAYFSWKYIETPFRDKNRFSRRAIFSYSALGSSFFITFGLIGYFGNGYQWRIGEDQKSFLSHFDNRYPDWKYFRRENWYENFRIDCDFYDIPKHWAGETTEERKEISSACFTRNRSFKKAVFIWGDSHAQHFYNGLKDTLPNTWQILQVASSGCAPTLRKAKDLRNYCDFSNQFAFKTILETKPDVVIIGQESGHNLEEMNQLSAKLRNAGVRKVIFMGPSPHWTKGGLPTLVATRLWNAIPRYTLLGLDMKVWRDDRLIKEGFHETGTAKYLSLFDYFCNNTGCRIYFGDNVRDGITTYDYGHLSSVASYHFSRDVLSGEVAEENLNNSAKTNPE